MNYDLDTSGLMCPYPLAKAKKFLSKMKKGERLQVISTDAASEIDFKVFAETSGNILIKHFKKVKDKYIFVLEKL